jgi:hypothetical protein
MSRTIYATRATGLTIYAKPSPTSDTPAWATDVVSLTENGTTGEYSGTVGDGPHRLYQQAGGSPASGDKVIGVYDAAVALAADYTATRAGYLDKLNVSGTLAHSDAANSYKADVSGLSTFNPASDQVIVATNNDKTGYALTQAFPSNFASLGINVSGHVERVTLVDTTTTNSDMRGTDNALLAASYTAPANADITAIKAKTDNLPSDPADQSAVESAIAAATSPLATSANLAIVAGYLDTEIAAILADTNELQTDWANGGRLDLILDARASQSSVDVVDGIVDEILVDTGTTLPAAIAGIEGGGAASVNVLPAVGIVADRSPGATISPVVGETINQSITLYSADGITPVSLAGKTLAIVFETLQGTDVAVISDANIAVSGDSSNVVTFAYPSAVTLVERTLRFAIKDAAAPLTEYLKGNCVVTKGPMVDA